MSHQIIGFRRVLNSCAHCYTRLFASRWAFCIPPTQSATRTPHCAFQALSSKYRSSIFFLLTCQPLLIKICSKGWEEMWWHVTFSANMTRLFRRIAWLNERSGRGALRHKKSFVAHMFLSFRVEESKIMRRTMFMCPPHKCWELGLPLLWMSFVAAALLSLSVWLHASP